MSRRTQFFAAIGRTPALLNFAINAIIGAGLFAWRPLVPWKGPGSVGADLIVGVLIVATVSAWAAIPQVARGTRAGLVAGLPAKSAWRFLPGGRAILSILLGFFLAIGMLLALIPPLERLAPSGMPGWIGPIFKGLTCMASGHAAIVVAGMRTLVGLGDRTAEHDAAVALACTQHGQPFDTLDKGCLACTDRERGSSVSPVWHMVLDGDIDDSVLREAVVALCTRYPSLRTRVSPVDGVRDHARDFRYVDVGDTDILELSDESPDEARARVLNRHIDLFEDPPVIITRVREPDRLHLLVHQHHAIADGRAFVGLLKDFAAIIAAVESGTQPETTPILRRPENEAYGLPPAELKRLTQRGFVRFVREALALKLRPLKTLAWNRGRDYSGANHTVHVVLDAAELEALRPVREAAGVSLNSMLTGAYLRAAKAWSEKRGEKVDRIVCEVIAETRPRDGSFVSFANHLAAYVTSVQGEDWSDTLKASRAVQDGVKKEADAQAHLERSLFRAWGVRTVSIDALRHLVLDVAELRAQVGFSNLIALRIPPLAGKTWRLDALWVTTPAAPPHGMVLTAVAYDQAVTFNFNFTDSVISHAEVSELAEAFVRELRGLGSPLGARFVSR